MGEAITEESPHSLEEKLLEDVYVPKDPFLEHAIHFGTDEGFAGVLNIGGTKIITEPARKMLSGWSYPVLAFGGLVIEKAGLFVRSAWQNRKTLYGNDTPLRRKLRQFRKGVWNGGKESLKDDLLFHDPLNGVLNLAGLALFPDIPPWIIVAAAWGVSVGAVAGVRVGKDEYDFRRFKRNLTTVGFGSESYIETRFYISTEEFPENFMDIDSVQESKKLANRYITKSLKKSVFAKSCRKCRKILPLNSVHNICNRCYRNQYY